MAFETEVKAVHFTDAATPYAPTHFTLLKQFIDNTPARGRIHVAISHFTADYPIVRNALVAAAARGVKIKVLLRTEYNEIIPSLIGIEARAEDGYFGTSLHMKLFLFSQTQVDSETCSYVSVISSAPLNASSVDKQQNTVVVADEKLYAGLLTHWNSMSDRSSGDPKPRIVSLDKDEDVLSTSGRIKAYLFPRSTDPVLHVIQNVKETRNPVTGARPRIHIAMARWSTWRESLLDALIDRAEAGCVVDLVLRVDWDGDDDGVDMALVRRVQRVLRSGNPLSLHLHLSRVDSTPIDVHSKYLLVDAEYGDGGDWERIVWTGSENWTKPALRSNDEVMIKIRDSRVHQLFVENHERLKSLCVNANLGTEMLTLGWMGP